MMNRPGSVDIIIAIVQTSRGAIREREGEREREREKERKIEIH